MIAMKVSFLQSVILNKMKSNTIINGLIIAYGESGRQQLFSAEKNLQIVYSESIKEN